MNKKQCEEIELVKRFFCEIGRPDVPLEAGDRPDVMARVDGERVGIEVTQFHADEKPGGRGGSNLRAQEVEKVRASGGGPYPHLWGNPDPRCGLVTRINEKISTAATYDKTGYDQLWLLICSQVPAIGAIGSTYALDFLDYVTVLNRETHAQLCKSPFSAVHFYLMMSHCIFSWSCSEKWHKVYPKD